LKGQDTVSMQKNMAPQLADSKNIPKKKGMHPHTLLKVFVGIGPSSGQLHGGKIGFEL
jgi:hypothetical protein